MSSPYLDACKPEPDDDDKQSTFSLDSEAIVAMGPAAAAPLKTLSTLIRMPPTLRAVREQIFRAEDLTWTAQEFDTHWPFVDNFWVLNQTRPRTRTGTQALYWYCRIWKKPAEQSRSHGHRNKRLRVAEPCSMRLKMLKQYEDDVLQMVSIKRHGACLEHNHTLEYLDAIKINDGVKSAVGGEVSRGYRVADINRNLQGVRFEENREALLEAGGQHVNLKAIHNAGAQFKRQNPDIRKRGNREDWEEQRQAAFEAIQDMGEGMVSILLKAVRFVDKMTSYGFAFAKRSKLIFSKSAFHTQILA